MTGHSIVLCTLTWKEGSGPRDPGAKMMVTEKGATFGTIGGGGMERILIEKALEVLNEGKPRILHFAMGVRARDEMISIDSKCGGEVKVFMDPLRPDPRLIVMGSGWIAQSTARIAHECGFNVIVVDDADTAVPENFPFATILNEAYPDSLKYLDIRQSDFVAVLHGETSFELEALRKAVAAEPRYIGLLGSTNKAREHKKRLIDEGFNPDIVNSIRGPIGICIGAETPEEIGVSIVAELIKVRHS